MKSAKTQPESQSAICAETPFFVSDNHTRSGITALKDRSCFHIANNTLVFEGNLENPQIVVTDLRNGMQWASGRFLLDLQVFDLILQRSVHALCTSGESWSLMAKTKTADSIVFHANHAQTGISFDFCFTLRADTLEVRIPIESIRQEQNWRYLLSRIDLFPHFGAVAEGTQASLILPNNGGLRIPCDGGNGTTATPSYIESDAAAQWLLQQNTDGPVTFVSKIYSEQATIEDQPNLPLYGMVIGQAGYATIVMEGRHDAEIILRARQGRDRSYSLNTAFTFRNTLHDDLDSIDRSLCYRFVNGKEANYSGIAKTYRRYLVEERGIVPLRLRAEQNSDVDKLTRSFISKLVLGFKKYPSRNEPDYYCDTTDGTGELMVFHTYDAARMLVQQLHDRGVENAWINVTGFNRDGHDGMHPTYFPVEKRFGGEEGLKYFLQFTKNLGYTSNVHVNYRDAYDTSEDFNPENVMHAIDGQMLRGLFWAGGQCYEVCPATVMNGTITRDLPLVKHLGVTGPLYIDNIFGVLENCHTPEHRLNRRQYCDATHEYISYARSLFGSITLESVTPEMIDVIDLAIDVPFPRGHANTHSNDSVLAKSGLKMEGIPLNQIVYHGLICHCMSFSSVQMEQDWLLYLVESGSLPRFDWRDNDPEQHMDRMVSAYNVCCRQLGHLQKEFIDAHDKLAEDVYITTYSNGESVIVNYSKESYFWNDREIFPRSFIHIAYNTK